MFSTPKSQTLCAFALNDHQSVQNFTEHRKIYLLLLDNLPDKALQVELAPVGGTDYKITCVI